MADVLTTTTNAKFIPTIIAQKALGRFASYMNLAKTVSRDFDWTPARVGQTINIPKRGAVVANDKTQGSNFTLQNPTATDVSVTLNKHKEVTLLLDDVTKVLENQDTLNGYAEDGAIALAEAVEQEIASLHASISNTVTMDYTSDATKDTAMLNIRKFFVDQKVPRGETRYLYADSTFINELLEVDKFARADALGKAGVIEKGALLNIYGLNIFESQNIQVSGSPVAYHNIAYTKNGFVLASRPLPAVPAGLGAVSTVVSNPDINLGLRVVSSWDAALGGLKITLDLLFGVAILDQRKVVEVESF
jgi:hypothetical protein